MAQQIGIPGPEASHGRFADAFVIFAVTVLSMALGAWFLLQLGLTLWPGLAAALTVYTVLLLFHLLVRRSLIADDGAKNREDMQWVPGEMEPSLSFGTERRDLSLPSMAPTDARPSAPGAGMRPDAHSRALPEASAEVEFHYRPRDAGGPLDNAAAGPVRRAPAPAKSGAASPSGLTADPMDGWAETQSSSPSEKNVELIQDLIKKLADELSDAPGSQPGAPPDAQPGEAEDAMIARSLAALDTAAASMRAAVGGAPGDSAAGAWWSGGETAAASTGASSAKRTQRMPASPPPLARSAPPLPNIHVSRAAEALAANRIEVLLEPIHALSDGRSRHFEVTARFLAPDGSPIETAQLQHSGLIPRIDTGCLVRTARVAQRLGERRREGVVLAAVAAESLLDQQFLDTATAQIRTSRDMGLVLCFAQAAVRAFTDAHRRSLNTLAAAGYRFAVQDLLDLNMDFGALHDAGFQFARLDAPVFLEGLNAAGTRVPAAELCRYVGDFGLTLIVGRIEDDWMLTRISGFGVQFGMGGLFGGPKLVKPEVAGEPSAA